MAAPCPRVRLTVVVVVLGVSTCPANASTRLRRKHKAELERLPDDDARVSRVAELNVQSSIDVLGQHPAVKTAIASRGLTLHGMIYDLGAGQLRLLESSAAKANNGLWSPNN